MQLLHITVREDWEAIGQQTALENSRVWRWILIAVVMSVVMSVLAVSIPALQPYRAYLQLVAPPLLLLILAFAIQAYYSVDRPRAMRRVWGAVLIGLLLLLATAAVLGRALALPLVGPMPLPLWFVLGLGAICWTGVGVVYRRQTAAMHRIGFVLARWPADLFLGAAFGAIFGFHMVITFGILRAPAWIEVVWAFCYLAGLRTLSEEVLLRGLGLSVLMEGMQLSLSQSMLRLALLTALLYASLAIGSPTPVAGVCYLAYSVMLSPLLVFLRIRRRSLAPAFGANLVFGLFLLPLVL